jgi:NAD(P)-dependent dehydrogenase (short-subunit alcohol dehydrogenase family)
MELKPLTDQVVVIMGASSGIGRETARRFARKGARVAISSRSEAGLKDLADDIGQNGGCAIPITADTSIFEQVRRLAERTEAEFGGIDTWVQVAGINLYAKFEDTTPEEWQRIIDVNLNGQAFGVMAALPCLKRRGRGAIICVSSVEARRSFPYQAAYSASKHGITALCEALRLELQHDGASISVTEILPATINTPLFEHARTKLGVVPQGPPPVYPPESVAKAIVHAAVHPEREIAVGGAAKALILGEGVSPALMDKMVSRIGFTQQLTNREKAATAPDNFYHPLEENLREKGPFHYRERTGSLYTWMAIHPWQVSALAMAAVGTAAMMSQGENEQEIECEPSHIARLRAAGSAYRKS